MKVLFPNFTSIDGVGNFLAGVRVLDEAHRPLLEQLAPAIQATILDASPKPARGASTDPSPLPPAEAAPTLPQAVS